MKVYVLVKLFDYEEFDVVGVYSSEEVAEQVGEEMLEKELIDDYWVYEKDLK